MAHNNMHKQAQPLYFKEPNTQHARLPNLLRFRKALSFIAVLFMLHLSPSSPVKKSQRKRQQREDRDDSCPREAAA